MADSGRAVKTGRAPTSGAAYTGRAPTSGARARADALRIVRKMLPYLWPGDQPWVRVRVVLSLAALVATKLIAVGTPFFYKGAVDGLAGESAQPLWMLAVGAAGLTAAYVMARFMRIGFQQLRDVVFARVGQRALRRLAFEVITHLHRLSMRYHIARRTGSLSRITERGIKGIDFLLRFLLFSIGPLFLELVLIAVVLLTWFDWRYLAAVALTVVLYIGFTARITEWRVKIRRVMNEQDQEAAHKAMDGLINFETVKQFGAQTREANRYDRAMMRYEAASLKTTRSLAVLNLGQAVLMNCGLMACLLLAAHDVALGALSVGGFVMVNAYMMQVIMPLDNLGFVYREIRQSLLDMGEMFDLLEQKAEIADRPNARPLRVHGGAVEFSHVRFGYEAARPILRDISFDAKAGQTIAIVGASGAGKSTIGRLLFRFYDVQKGAVRIDGQDVREVTQASLQAAIGIVPQETVLFHDTLYYNIAYGRPAARQADIAAAAQAAKIHDFIMELPQQYQTMVGERGLKLSGGERQRVGLARALLKNPPILLLDEATSALDTRTERAIQESLRALGSGRTVVTIAHRLSTIVESDEILVLARGRIAERGRHAHLLAQGGRYAQMWQRQLKTPPTKPPAEAGSVQARVLEGLDAKTRVKI